MRMDKDNIINEAIARLLSRENDCSDIITISNWLMENENNKTQLQELEEYWDRPIGNFFDAELSYAANKEAIFKGKSTKHGPVPRKVLLPAILSAAAIISAIGVILFTATKKPSQVYNYTAQGEVTSFDLPDGSEVHLNKGSTLCYYDNPSGKERKVSLQGEAFFNVRHDSAHPFVVNIEDAYIRVLGTKFNVNCGYQNNVIVTTLIEGAVEFVHRGNKISLSPSEQLIYDRSRGETRKAEVEVERYTSWKEGLYKYKSISLGELAEELSINYGRQVLIDPSLKDIIMSGTFHRSQSLEEILRILQSCFDVKWKYNEDIIYLSSK